MLKHSSLAQSAFVPCAKSVHIQHNKRYRLLFGRLFTKLKNEHKLGIKIFSKTSFQSRMGLNKGNKQGRDERMQECCPISAMNFSSSQVLFLRSFISALFLSFFRPIFKSNEVLQNIHCFSLKKKNAEIFGIAWAAITARSTCRTLLFVFHHDLLCSLEINSFKMCSDLSYCRILLLRNFCKEQIRPTKMTPLCYSVTKCIYMRTILGCVFTCRQATQNYVKMIIKRNVL